MSYTSLFFAAVIAAILLSFVDAKLIEKRDIGNGQVYHKYRFPINKNNNQQQKQFGETTNAPMEQARNVMVVVTNYCNGTNARIGKLQSQSVLDGGWTVPPPAELPSFYAGQATGFEAKENPGQSSAHLRGKFFYKYAPSGPWELNAEFDIVHGEWEMSMVTATAMGVQIYSSEYKHVAVYNIVFGNDHIFSHNITC